MMSFPPTPATTSMMSMAGPPRRERRKTSLQLGLEPQTARQMVAKVTQQHEAELHGLKDHMAKENLRHQAEIRRLDHDHKKDVQNIHKEALLQIRALNRFKDCVATLLDRERKFFLSSSRQWHVLILVREGRTRNIWSAFQAFSKHNHLFPCVPIYSLFLRRSRSR